jgi:thiol-disulfide isomerase/thioredoxin
MKLAGLLLLFTLLIAVVPAASEPTRWYTYEEGILAAGVKDKPIIVDFYADWCQPCIAMEEGTYPDQRVVREMGDFVAIKVDTQKRIDIESKYRIAYYPTVVFLDSKGKEITRHVGYLGPDEMVMLIKESRGKLPKETAGFETLSVLAGIILGRRLQIKLTGPY